MGTSHRSKGIFSSLSPTRSQLGGPGLLQSHLPSSDLPYPIRFKALKKLERFSHRLGFFGTLPKRARVLELITSWTSYDTSLNASYFQLLRDCPPVQAPNSNHMGPPPPQDGTEPRGLGGGKQHYKTLAGLQFSIPPSLIKQCQHPTRSRTPPRTIITKKTPIQQVSHNLKQPSSTRPRRTIQVVPDAV